MDTFICVAVTPGALPGGETHPPDPTVEAPLCEVDPADAVAALPALPAPFVTVLLGPERLPVLVTPPAEVAPPDVPAIVVTVPPEVPEDC